MNVEQEILNAIRNDHALGYKKGSEGKVHISGLTCPECGKPEMFISVEQPYQLKCSRNNNCGHSESTRQRYSFLWENLGDKHPPTEQDPKATASAYMSDRRGFPLVTIGNWFEQGTVALPNGRAAPTVRFILWDGIWWDRLINDRDVRDNIIKGKQTKALFKSKISYRKKGWQPPGQVINENDHVFIVEGIFHAIAFHLVGKKAIAAFSCTNLPREIIEANKGKKVTWCLSYDAGKGGEEASLKYLKELKDINELARIVLPHSAGIDWDDLYREGKLNDEYLEESTWRGRVLSAKSVDKKAYVLYAWRQFSFSVITFKNETYSIKVDSSKLSEDLEKSDGSHKISFANSDHEQLFSRHLTVRHIANCELNFLHIEKDKYTAERKYLFDVYKPGKRDPFLVGFTPNHLAESKTINNTLMNQTDFGYFKGSSRDVDWLTKRWAGQNLYTVETVPYIGYEETSKVYVFPEVGYHQGNLVKVNKYGYLKFDHIAIKTTLKNDSQLSQKFDCSFLQDFITVFHFHGVATLAYFTLSLFSQQVKAKQQFLTFLEVTGEPEAGKSTLIRFLWRMLGMDDTEGVDILSLSEPAEIRLLSQVSNMPVVFLESDNEESAVAKGGKPRRGVDYERYKKLYDKNGAIGSRGVKTNDNQTNNYIFRGALVFTQNATIQSSPAVLSRITHLHCTRAHKRPENIPIAERLAAKPVAELSGYLHHVLTHEKAWLDAYFEAWPIHRKRLLSAGINSARVANNHAQLMAAMDALQVLFKNFKSDDLDKCLTYMESRARDRDLRLNQEHPTVQRFWEAYNWINPGQMEEKNEKGHRVIYYDRLNHSINDSLIAINLNHFSQEARQAGQEAFSISELAKLLPESKHYKFIESKTIRSKIKKTQIRCLVFAKPSISTSD